MSVALLGLVFASAFAIANRTLNGGQSAQQRSRVLAAAQSQIEFIIAAYKTANPVLDSFKRDQPFCIMPDGVTIQNASQSVEGDQVCQPYDDQPYGLGVTYSTDGVFTVTARWKSSTSGIDEDRLYLYYRNPPS